MTAGTIRWWVKKAARRSVAAMSWGPGWLSLRRRFDARPQVRVLTYHRVRDAVRDPFSVTVDEFDRQMAWLRAELTVISLDDLLDFLEGRRPLVNDAVLVTIDDGFDDLRTGALPVLVRHQIPAVAFITAGEMTTQSAMAEDRKLTRGDIAALAGHGVAVGSHAWDHRSLGRMTPDELVHQAEGSRSDLEAVAGYHPVAFAYPFGTRLDFNAASRTALCEAGYRCAFTSQHGPVRRDSDPMELPRIKIEGGDPFWVFRLAMQGGLDGWRLIDRLAPFLQWTERRHHSKSSTSTPARHSSSAHLSGRPLG